MKASNAFLGEYGWWFPVGAMLRRDWEVRYDCRHDMYIVDFIDSESGRANPIDLLANVGFEISERCPYQLLVGVGRSGARRFDYVVQ